MTEITPSALAHHEAVIERGLNTFVDVGNALLSIRNERLYRADHATFEDYCRERWGFSRTRSYELMSAAKVVSAIADTDLPAPANEGQARELAKVPETERADVWRETVERTDGKPTAAAIRETYQPPRSEPTPTPLSDADLLAGTEWSVGTHPAEVVAPVPLPTGQDRDEAAVRVVGEAIARHVPDPDAENREWRRAYLAALSAARRPLQFRAHDVAERADGECLDELARLADDITAYVRNVRAEGADANVIQIGGRR